MTPVLPQAGAMVSYVDVCNVSPVRFVCRRTASDLCTVSCSCRGEREFKHSVGISPLEARLGVVNFPFSAAVKAKFCAFLLIPGLKHGLSMEARTAESAMQALGFSEKHAQLPGCCWQSSASGRNVRHVSTAAQKPDVAAAPREAEDVYMQLELEIFNFMQSSATPHAFPSKRELHQAGRADLVAAILEKGGWLTIGWDHEATVSSNASDIVQRTEPVTDGRSSGQPSPSAAPHSQRVSLPSTPSQSQIAAGARLPTKTVHKDSLDQSYLRQGNGSADAVLRQAAVADGPLRDNQPIRYADNGERISSRQAEEFDERQGNGTPASSSRPRSGLRRFWRRLWRRQTDASSPVLEVEEPGESEKNVSRANAGGAADRASEYARMATRWGLRGKPIKGLPRRDRKYKFEVKRADLAGTAAALRQTEATSSNVAKPSTRGTRMSSSNSNKLVTKALGGQAPTAKPNDHTENAAAHTSAAVTTSRRRRRKRPSRGGPLAASAMVEASNLMAGQRPVVAAVVAAEPSTVQRIRALQASLVATREALQHGREALLESGEGRRQEREETLAELGAVGDALEHGDTELMRTRRKLRSARAEFSALEGQLAANSRDTRVQLEDFLDTPLRDWDSPPAPPAAEGLLPLREVKVVWPNEGQEVLLTGSFTGWSDKIKMEKSNAGVFATVLELHPGQYEIKFIVDGSWRVDPKRPMTYSGGIENNILFVF